jgi:hypothetical protein
LVNANEKEWQGKAITIDDASQYSGRPIHIMFRDGRVTELDPPSTRIFVGGG